MRGVREVGVGGGGEGTRGSNKDGLQLITTLQVRCGRRLPQFRDPRCIETCSTSTPVGKGCNSALSVQTEILK